MGEIRRIKASAGSGKTYSLTQNYLNRLLSATPSPRIRRACVNGGGSGGAEEILAITFTNAAATEMRARIIKRLKEDALGLSGKDAVFDAATAKLWLEALLRDYNSLNIRTIDSLLHLVVRASALKLNINPDFEPVFNIEDAFSPYVDLFLQKAAENPEYADLLKRACLSLLEFGSETNGKGFLAGDKISGRIYKLIEAILTGYMDEADDAQEIERRFMQEAAAVQKAAKTLLTIPEDAWKKSAYAGMVKFAENPKKPPNSAYLTGLSAERCLKKAAVPIYKNLFEGVNFDEYLEKAPAYVAAALFLPFKKIADIIIAAYTSQMGAESLIPNELTPALARRALDLNSGVSDAICALGSRLTHYLVDEFQDTSDKQWRAMRPLALEALGRNGSLTLVGDLKQSIYGFRGGNPALFEEVSRDGELTAAAGAPKDVTLESNWRSGEKIVEFNNRFFGALREESTLKEVVNALAPRAFPAKRKEEIAGEIRKIYSDCAQKAAANPGVEGYVRGEQIEYEDTVGRDEQIMSRLVELIGEVTTRRAGGPDKPKNYGELIVLVNANKHAGMIARAFIDAKIPVITENSLSLSEHPLICEAAGLISFLANPVDDLAFWAVVSGALVKGNDLIEWPNRVELANLAVNRKEPLYKAFAREYPAQWTRIIEPFYNQSQLLSAYDVVMEWFAFLDAERRFSADKSFLRRFMEIARRAEKDGVYSVTSFTDFWREKGAGEKIPMPENANAVRIMTIHKAKGLQAPVVVVPYTGFPAKASGAPGIREIDGLKIPMFVTGPAAGVAYENSIAATALEAINKLYVAFTRPEEELYFFVGAKIAKNPDNDSKKTVVRILADDSGFAVPFSLGKAPEGAGRNESGIINLSGKNPAKTKRVLPPEDWRPMSWLPRLKIFRAKLEDESFTANERGSLSHAALENMRITGSPAEDAAAALRSVENAPQFSRGNHDERDGVLKTLEWFAAIPEAREWLEKGTPEQSMINEKGEVLRADLIVPFKEGTLIIDYKTGKPSPAHVEQVRDYMTLIKNSGQLPGKIAGLIIYLDEKSFRVVTEEREYGLDSEFAARLEEAFQ